MGLTIIWEPSAGPCSRHCHWHHYSTYNYMGTICRPMFQALHWHHYGTYNYMGTICRPVFQTLPLAPLWYLQLYGNHLQAHVPDTATGTIMVLTIIWEPSAGPCSRHCHWHYYGSYNYMGTICRPMFQALPLAPLWYLQLYGNHLQAHVPDTATGTIMVLTIIWEPSTGPCSRHCHWHHYGTYNYMGTICRPMFQALPLAPLWYLQLYGNHLQAHVPDTATGTIMVLTIIWEPSAGPCSIHCHWHHYGTYNYMGTICRPMFQALPLAPLWYLQLYGNHLQAHVPDTATGTIMVLTIIWEPSAGPCSIHCHWHHYGTYNYMGTICRPMFQALPLATLWYLQLYGNHLQAHVPGTATGTIMVLTIIWEPSVGPCSRHCRLQHYGTYNCMGTICRPMFHTLPLAPLWYLQLYGNHLQAHVPYTATGTIMVLTIIWEPSAGPCSIHCHWHHYGTYNYMGTICRPMFQALPLAPLWNLQLYGNHLQAHVPGTATGTIMVLTIIWEPSAGPCSRHCHWYHYGTYNYMRTICRPMFQTLPLAPLWYLQLYGNHLQAHVPGTATGTIMVLTIIWEPSAGPCSRHCHWHHYGTYNYMVTICRPMFQTLPLAPLWYLQLYGNHLQAHVPYTATGTIMVLTIIWEPSAGPCSRHCHWHHYGTYNYMGTICRPMFQALPLAPLWYLQLYGNHLQAHVPGTATGTIMVLTIIWEPSAGPCSRLCHWHHYGTYNYMGTICRPMFHTLPLVPLWYLQLYGNHLQAHVPGTATGTIMVLTIIWEPSAGPCSRHCLWHHYGTYNYMGTICRPMFQTLPLAPLWYLQLYGNHLQAHVPGTATGTIMVLTIIWEPSAGPCSRHCHWHHYGTYNYMGTICRPMFHTLPLAPLWYLQLYGNHLQAHVPGTALAPLWYLQLYGNHLQAHVPDTATGTIMVLTIIWEPSAGPCSRHCHWHHYGTYNYMRTICRPMFQALPLAPLWYLQLYGNHLQAHVPDTATGTIMVLTIIWEPSAGPCSRHCHWHHYGTYNYMRTICRPMFQALPLAPLWYLQLYENHLQAHVPGTATGTIMVLTIIWEPSAGPCSRHCHWHHYGTYNYMGTICRPMFQALPLALLLD